MAHQDATDELKEEIDGLNENYKKAQETIEELRKKLADATSEGD